MWRRQWGARRKVADERAQAPGLGRVRFARVSHRLNGACSQSASAALVAAEVSTCPLCEFAGFDSEREAAKAVRGLRPRQFLFGLQG